MSCIMNRRSIRSFKSEAVSKELIRQILQAACWAPSGKNGQPWKFSIIMDDESLKERICSLSIYRNWLKYSPCLITVFLDKSISYDYCKDLQAIGAAIQNMLLVAHENDLGTCWVGEMINHESKIKECLVIPEHYQLMSVIAIGYKNITTTSKRKSIDDVIFSWK